MLITILATIGLFFIIAIAYRRGKRNGIKEAIDYFITEMNRKKIDIDIINDYDTLGKTPKFEIYKKIRYFIGRGKNDWNS